MHYHKKLQRRLLIALLIVIALILAIVVPLTISNDLRYEVAMQANLIPGKHAHLLADGDDGAQLIVLSLDNGDADGTSPWLFRAQFIAWPNDQGYELENLETGERADIPLGTIDFQSSNGDGSLVLLRGIRADTAANAAFTIAPDEMLVQGLPNATRVPDEPGDWATPSWEKTSGACNRPSPNQRFVGCFARAGAASYLAGDWQFDLQMWGDFETVNSLYRGRGFLPTVGFARNDMVVYLQNENGIVKIDIPKKLLDAAPTGTPYASPQPSPSASGS